MHPRLGRPFPYSLGAPDTQLSSALPGAAPGMAGPRKACLEARGLPTSPEGRAAQQQPRREGGSEGLLQAIGKPSGSPAPPHGCSLCSLPLTWGDRGAGFKGSSVKHQPSAATLLQTILKMETFNAWYQTSCSARPMPEQASPRDARDRAA